MLAKKLLKLRLTAMTAFILFCLIVGSLALHYGW
jgi:hypothetical protein